MRTSSPISDPQPYEIPQIEAPQDPVQEEKVSFRKDDRYDRVLKNVEDRIAALKQEVATKPDGMTYQEYGIKNEVNNRIIQELTNFIADIELAYGLQK